MPILKFLSKIRQKLKTEGVRTEHAKNSINHTRHVTEYHEHESFIPFLDESVVETLIFPE